MNTILATDSYKLTHWKQYPENVTGVYSYLEARPGAEYPDTVFFGLQSILKKLEGVVVTGDDIQEANALAECHFGDPNAFNFDGWWHVIDDHEGKLPLKIMAVPEGEVVPVGNVLMTVENTCSKCFWLTNALESLLLHVWYPTTVATLSYHVKQMMKGKLEQSADTLDALPFMLHDFGYRGASSHETAAIGGAGHLINFMGTDTLPAMMLALTDYDAHAKSLAFSVPATEHSVMTSLGKTGEMKIVSDLIDTYPTGILSVVADSYDIYGFVNEICYNETLRDRILQRVGKFVVRPDSITKEHSTPEELVVYLMRTLWLNYRGITNSKGYKMLDPHIGLLWGDGIGPKGIEKILDAIIEAGFSAENMVFGMGGGLLQKVNRDTQRFAFKCSAQERNGVWVPVQKGTFGKQSKGGRLALIHTEGGYVTMSEQTQIDYQHENVLRVVFENGELKNQTTFDEIRQRAA